MGKRNHFIIVGRTSRAIAQAIVDQFGDGGRDESGPFINRPGPIIQARFGTHSDGEPTANLFVDGKLSDHPIRQILSAKDKKDLVKALKDADVTIVHSMSGTNASSRMMSQLFMSSYLTQQVGVHRTRLLSTYMAGMRSDRPFVKLDDNGVLKAEYNAISCGVYAQQLVHAGVRDVIGIEAHSRDGLRLFEDALGEKHVRFLNTGAFLARSIRSDFERVVANNLPSVMIGSPDGLNKAEDYGIARASSFAAALYEGTNWARDAKKENFKERRFMFGIHKERSGPGETRIADFHGDVNGKSCIIVDDIISSGGTILQAAEELYKRGAKEVFAAATHGVLPGKALTNLLGSKHIDRLYLTDTVPGIVEKVSANGFDGHEKLRVSTVAPLVCEAISDHFPRNNPLPFVP